MSKNYEDEIDEEIPYFSIIIYLNFQLVIMLQILKKNRLLNRISQSHKKNINNLN